jgi:hypothetical protein
MDLDHNEGGLYITELSLTSDIHQGEAEALSNTSKTAREAAFGGGPSAGRRLFMHLHQGKSPGLPGR